MISIISILSILASAQTLYSCSGANICGDLNCDGYTDNHDSSTVVAHIRGRITLNPSLIPRADVDRNNVVDTNDAVKITHFNAGLVSALYCRQNVLPAVRRQVQGPQPIPTTQQQGPTSGAQTPGGMLPSPPTSPQQTTPCRNAQITPITYTTIVQAPSAQGNTLVAALSASMTQALRTFDSNGEFNAFRNRLNQACGNANPGQNCRARIMNQNLIPTQCTKNQVSTQVSVFRTLSHSNIACDTTYLYLPQYISNNNYRTQGGQIRVTQTSTNTIICTRN